MDLGDYISRYRKEAGLTIDELSARSGVPKGTINKIIAGTTKSPTLETVQSLATALGKTINDFVDTSSATKNSPDTAEAAPEEGPISLEESNRLLVHLGLIEEGQDLSDDDLAFMTIIIDALDAWFRKFH